MGMLSIFFFETQAILTKWFGVLPLEESSLLNKELSSEKNFTELFSLKWEKFLKFIYQLISWPLWWPSYAQVKSNQSQLLTCVWHGFNFSWTNQVYEAVLGTWQLNLARFRNTLFCKSFIEFIWSFLSISDSCEIWNSTGQFKNG